MRYSHNKNKGRKMKNTVVKNIGIGLISIVMLSGNSMADDTNTTVASKTTTSTESNNSSSSSGLVQLIDVAGRQRMLSQRIAKDYLYAGKKVATTKAEQQLDTAFSELISAHKVLEDSINDPEITNLLSFVKMSSEDFKATSKEEFTTDNAQLILDLSESMLEGSQYIVNSLKEVTNANESKVVALSGKQRMLAQRIAKYYIAYQAGIKDKNTIDQMKDAVKTFSESHEALMKNQENTPDINRKLNQIDRLWKIVYKFYLNIEKGGLPLIVFNTTDSITKKMNEITKLYVELYK